jgi:hypothetical protein
MWKHHPVTVALRRYLSDVRDLLMREHTTRWATRSELSPAEEEDRRALCAVIEDVKNVEFRDIFDFYKVPEEFEAEEEEETE